MKSNYDLYEYRIPTMEDYCCQPEALGMAIKNNYSCYLKTQFLPDGSKFCFTSSFISSANIFVDMYSKKFEVLKEIRHFTYWNRNKKSVPVLRRKDEVKL